MINPVEKQPKKGEKQAKAYFVTLAQDWKDFHNQVFTTQMNKYDMILKHDVFVKRLRLMGDYWGKFPQKYNFRYFDIRGVNPELEICEEMDYVYKHIRTLMDGADRVEMMAEARRAMNEKIDQAVVNQLNSLTDTVNRQLEGSVCGAIGLEESCGTYKIIHGGKISTLLSTKINKIIEQAMNAIFSEEKITSIIAECIPQILAAFKSNFNYKMQESAARYADSKVHEHVKAIVDKNFKIDEMTTNLDLHNPKTGDKGYEILVMEEMVKGIQSDV